MVASDRLAHKRVKNRQNLPLFIQKWLNFCFWFIRKSKSEINKPEEEEEDATSLPFTEQLSILIPGTQSTLQEFPDNTPQPKPRKKHSHPVLSYPHQAFDDSHILSGELGALINGKDAGQLSPPRSPLRRDHTVPPLNLTSLHEYADGEGM